jgi:hypothetical protein
MEIIPRYLYVYKSFDDTGYWKDILINKRLYMARPEQFNDPFEGQLFPFSTSSCGQSINLAAGKGNKDVTQFLNDYRVVCLSSNIRNKAMWAYYADDYKGFAIRFKTTKDKGCFMQGNVFAAAERVIYKKESEEIPCREVCGYREAKKIQRQCLLYKSDDWRQEEEFRVIKYSRSKNKKFLHFGYDDIESVILGARISEANRETITGICEANHIKIRNMWLATIESRIEFYSKEPPRFDGSSYKRFIDDDI